jgi:hypothetical protein
MRRPGSGGGVPRAFNLAEWDRRSVDGERAGGDLGCERGEWAMIAAVATEPWPLPMMRRFAARRAADGRVIPGPATEPMRLGPGALHMLGFAFRVGRDHPVEMALGPRDEPVEADDHRENDSAHAGLRCELG